MKHFILYISLITFFCCSELFSQDTISNYESYTLSINCWKCGQSRITIERKDEAYKLAYNFANRIVRHDGSYIADTSKSITAEQWNEFIGIIENGNFISQPSSIPGDIGEDGATWLLEGHKAGSGHSISRWVPYRNTLIYEAGKYLVKLCGDERLLKLIEDASRE